MSSVGSLKDGSRESGEESDLGTLIATLADFGDFGPVEEVAPVVAPEIAGSRIASRRFAFFPARTALINVDMQRCFVEGTPLASPDGLALVYRVAREAAQHDFRVFFLSDGTATKEMGGMPAEDLQRATCASLSMVFAQITTVDEIMDKIRSSVPPSVVGASS